MSRQQLIAEIQRLNRSAGTEFLRQFGSDELDLYWRRLLRLERRYGSSDLLQPVSLRELSTGSSMPSPVFTHRALPWGSVSPG